MKRMICLRAVIAFLTASFLFLNVPSLYANETQKLDINNATVSELVVVKGIGEAKAKAIVDFIKSKNGIKNMDELLEVKGVGPKVLERLKQKFEVKPKE